MFRIVIIGGIFKVLHVFLAYIIKCTQGEGYSFMHYVISRFLSGEVGKIRFFYFLIIANYSRVKFYYNISALLMLSIYICIPSSRDAIRSLIYSLMLGYLRPLC